MSKTKKLRKLKSGQEAKVVAIETQSTHDLTKKRKISFKESLKITGKVIAFGKPYHKYLYLSLLSIFLQTFCQLMQPVYLGKCIDCLIGKGQVQFATLGKYTAIMLVFVVLNALFTYLGDVLSNIYCFKSAGYIRNRFFAKINKVPLKFVDQNSHGDLLSRLSNDVSMLTDGFLEGITGITNGVITILGTLIFMLVLDFKLALIIALIAPISLIASFYIAKKSYKLFVAHVETEGEANGYLEEMISGSRVVKAFGFEDKSEKKFEAINQRYYKVCEKEEFISNIANPLTRVINSAVYCCVGLFGGLQIVAGRATVGLISSFLNYANSFGKPFNELAGEVTELQSAFAAATRIFEVLNATEEVSDNNLPVLKKAEGHVTAENVYFSYNDRVKLIENFNLTVKPGQRVAIVGPTGCGKTTLINLLMRFYDVNTGVIKVDETPITDVKRSSLRAQYGMVLQESWLYNATIRENIAYGKPNASMEEIIEAAKLAGAHEFIDRMPDKYETIVTEGGNNISQGQKQLLCIARIMLVKPPMLILDEATSNIDTRTELKIQQAFNTIMTGRTTFIVAHRLSTIVTADKILVMNKGNIIEQGTHDELIARHGFYYHLYNSQYAKPSDKPEAL